MAYYVSFVWAASTRGSLTLQTKRTERVIHGNFCLSLKRHTIEMMHLITIHILHSPTGEKLYATYEKLLSYKAKNLISHKIIQANV